MKQKMLARFEQKFEKKIRKENQEETRKEIREKFKKEIISSIEIRNREECENRDDSFHRKKFTKKLIKISNDEFNDDEFNDLNNIDIKFE